MFVKTNTGENMKLRTFKKYVTINLSKAEMQQAIIDLKKHHLGDEDVKIDDKLVDRYNDAPEAYFLLQSHDKLNRTHVIALNVDLMDDGSLVIQDPRKEYEPEFPTPIIPKNFKDNLDPIDNAENIDDFIDRLFNEDYDD